MPTTQHDNSTERRTVRIPGSPDHAGHRLIAVTLPVGLPDLRRTPRRDPTGDLLRRLPSARLWRLDRHVDTYAAVRVEDRHRDNG